MSNPISINWLSSASNSGTIASPQTVTAGAALVLNPNRQDPHNPQKSYYEFENVWRTVSLTSAGSLSGSFLVTGYGMTTNGSSPQASPCIISEVIDAPTDDTVFSSNIYKKIFSITASASTGSSQVSVGFGSSGMTDFVFMNVNRPSWNASVQCQVLNYQSLTYGVYHTLLSAEYIKDGFGNQPLPVFDPYIASGSTTNEFAGIPYPVTALYAYVNNTNVDATTTDGLVFTVLQEGDGVGPIQHK